MEVMVLDASTSAQPFRQVILDTACSVLVGRTNVSVLFLGSCQQYETDAGGLYRDGPKWFEQNSTRCSLLSAMCDSDTIGPDDRVVVIGSGSIYDMEDLEQWPGRPSLLLVHTGDPMNDLVGSLISNELNSTSPALISQFLDSMLIGDTRLSARSSGGSARDSAQEIVEAEWRVTPDTKTHFPVLELKSVGYRMQLLPVTKLQYEQFLTASDYERFRMDSKGTGDEWYKEVFLSQTGRNVLDAYPLENPRIPYTGFTAMGREREQLFATGLLPDEVSAFARWLGEDWEVPTLELWRECYHGLERTKLTAMGDAMVDGLFEYGYHRSVSVILKRLCHQLNPENMLTLSLMSGGLFEWVRRGTSCGQYEYAGLGKPRYSFSRHLVDPARCSNPLEPFNPNDERLYDFGFRLVQKM